jgi:WD40 repeat protein/energy-coupling factor transporter ATP-binding protein EcfA2
MASRNIRVGNITKVSGEVTIAGGDIYKGYTREQVSDLLTQITSTFQPKPFDGRCPYKGLDAFAEEDAELFFGREQLVDDLLSRVTESRTVFITGPSGSGKSSLVRAGLIPALKSGAIQTLHSERWLVETMKPGRDPIAELGRVASGLAGTLSAGEEIRTKGLGDETVLAQWCEIALKDSPQKRAVIFIDQFEEVFTQIAKEEQRLAFLNLLTHAAMTENGRIILLFAMRSDFVSNCATYSELNTLLNQQFIQIGAMQPAELVSAIAQPALRVGLRIDPDLIAQIINDMQGEPGALPLMQFALKDLFDSQQQMGGMIALTLNDYLQQGGIRKSLERHADNAFAKLSENEQVLAHSIFARLIEIGRGTQDTRRTALFDELIPANTSTVDVETIVQKLADARLITTDEQAGKDTVTISHEKLIDAWPWLKRLVNENRDLISLQNEITGDAKEWDEHDQDVSYLYAGARLAYAREQLETRKLALSSRAREFIQAGYARQRRGQVLLIGGVSAIILLLVIAVFIFRKQTSDYADMAEKAHMRELAALSTAWRDRNLPLALLLGAEVFKNENSIQTRGLLLDNLQFNPQLLQFLRGHTDQVMSVVFSPDGKLLASGSADHSIMLWDITTHQPVGQPLSGHTKAVTSIAFSPDGSILASGSEDNSVLLWDVKMHEGIGQPLVGHSGPVNSVAFSPDGNWLASGSEDGTVILWDVKTHEPIGQPLVGHSSPVNCVAFSPDGNLLASGSDDRTIILWDLNTHTPLGPPLSGRAGSVYSLAFQPDGTTLASGSNDNTIILWDVNTREPIDQPLKGHFGRISSLAFSPDGSLLASGSYDNTVILWDMNTHQRIVQPLRGHSNSIHSVAFSPDGKTLASASADNTVIVWGVEMRQRADQLLLGHSGSVNSLAFSPDGKTLASGHFDKTIIFSDPISRESIGQPLTGHSDQVTSLAFNPDGTLLASGSDDQTVILWDAATRQMIGQPLTGHSGPVRSVAFSPDGELLVSGGADGTLMLWDVAAHQLLGEPLAGHTGPVTSLAFSPDGAMIASGSDDKTIILWDVNTHETIDQPLRGHTDGVRSVAFSPDGKILASGGNDQTILLWEMKTHKVIDPPLKGHSGLVTSLAFSPDGKILASGSYDKTIILWDVQTHERIGQPLSGHTGAVYDIAFSPDGKILASGSIDKNILLWDADAQSWLAKTCQRASRNFTRAEWTQYFGDKEYRKTCEQWPLEPG